MQIATIGGRQVRYLDSGDPRGAALVLVHAFPVGVRMFEPQHDAFEGWRLVTPALPGFDGSDPPDTPSIDAYARSVIGLLDALGIERAVFGGVSLGGYVLFGVLRQAASRVAGVLLADTRSAADTEEASAGRTRMLRLLRDQGVPAVASEMLPKLLGNTSRQTRPGLVDTVRGMIEVQTAEGIAAAIEALRSRPDSTPMLPGMAVPALVVAGAEDGITPPVEMERMAAAIQGAAFLRIEQAGHLASLEQPERFNRAVMEWLGQYRTGLRPRLHWK